MFDQYVREFMHKAGNMVSENLMMKAEHGLLFYKGLQSSLRRNIKLDLVKAVSQKMTKKGPVPMEKIIEVMRDYYSHDDVDYDSNLLALGHDSEMGSDSDKNSNSSRKKKRRQSKHKKSARTRDQGIDHEISSNAGQMGCGGPGCVCYGCDKQEGAGLDHPLHFRDCTDILALINEGIFMLSAIRSGKVLWKDGTSLLAYNDTMIHGVAGHMRSMVEKVRSPKGGSSHSAAAMSLYCNGVLVLGREVYAFTVEETYAFATTHSQAKKSGAKRSSVQCYPKEHYDNGSTGCREA
ncbi:hypothetical protein WOLCODRAFT_21210 [Wolfiporia cocos MD-104 SS10]|uniref:Uncharacterized protein n=1 Tax=Wolfiporia cocos (strain MD-104) TaxID=742152 RepID=A0A2H3JQB9_WOLCO|nr:hypothetical protein WOLCODRAFT_21210 [Wolfiporia cocos MD-104 SS10]